MLYQHAADAGDGCGMTYLGMCSSVGSLMKLEPLLAIEFIGMLLLARARPRLF